MTACRVLTHGFTHMDGSMDPKFGNRRRGGKQTVSVCEQGCAGRCTHRAHHIDLFQGLRCVCVTVGFWLRWCENRVISGAIHWLKTRRMHPDSTQTPVTATAHPTRHHRARFEHSHHTVNIHTGHAMRMSSASMLSTQSADRVRVLRQLRVFPVRSHAGCSWYLLLGCGILFH